MSAARLAAFAAELRFEHCPAAVQDRVRWILADTLAAIVAGTAEPELRALARRQAPGAATVPGLGPRFQPEAAALLGGSAGTFLELDEGNRFARGHPAVHIVPALLAHAETVPSDGPTFLGALLAGYEVCARIAGASRLRGPLHPHGTWGTVGAAVGCGRLAGRGAGAMETLIGIASSLMTATSKQTMLEGGLVRNVYAGLASRNGLLALQLVDSGFGAEHDGLASLFGRVLSDHWDTQALQAGLVTHWQVLQSYFKMHSCCRYNHGVLDALDLLAARGELPPAEQLERVQVDAYDLAAELVDPAPANTLAARFSVPFAVATRVVNGHSGVDAFGWAAVRDPRVQSLARRVSVREEPAFTRRLPHERPARVTLHWRDGRQAQAEVAHNRGDETAPYGEDLLQRKFIALAGRAWPAAHAERVLGATLELGRAGGDLQAWLALLRPAASLEEA